MPQGCWQRRYQQESLVLSFDVPKRSENRGTATTTRKPNIESVDLHGVRNLQELRSSILATQNALPPSAGGTYVPQAATAADTEDGEVVVSRHTFSPRLVRYWVSPCTMNPIACHESHRLAVCIEPCRIPV